MRVHWIASIFSILVSMGVLLVIMGQYHMIDVLNKTGDRLKVETERLAKEFPHEAQLKDLMDKEFSQKLKEVEEMETAMVKLFTGMESKKGEIDTCQAEMKTEDEVVNAEQKTKQETEETLKVESDAWAHEINSLKAKLSEHSPVCDYVKKGAMIGNLCGIRE